jgi:hypothetical protein
MLAQEEYDAIEKSFTRSPFYRLARCLSIGGDELGCSLLESVFDGDGRQVSASIFDRLE